MKLVMISSPVLTTSDPSNGGRVRDMVGGGEGEDRGYKRVCKFGALLPPNSPIELLSLKLLIEREREID